jgi:hypothetical protein
MPISDVRSAVDFDEEGNETDKPLSLEERFEMLLDELEQQEKELNRLKVRFEASKNHRHTIGNGMYSGKSEE